MPHIKLEHSSNLKFELNNKTLFAAIHQVLEQAGINIENCKSRTLELDDFYVGSGGENKGFIHLEVAILEGRSENVKKEAGKKILQMLKNNFQSKEYPGMQITVEIRDISKQFYFKYPEGTLPL